MVVVPLSKPVNSGVNRAADQSESPSWTGFAAGGALVAGGLLLMSGQRRAGIVAASAGTALALLDQKQALLTIWSALPGLIDQVQQILGKVEGVVEEIDAKRQTLDRILAR